MLALTKALGVFGDVTKKQILRNNQNGLQWLEGRGAGRVRGYDAGK